MIDLLYFARLREAFGLSSEQAELPAEVRDVSALIGWLRARGGAWETELAPGKPFRVAVNQEMADGAALVEDGDEIAVFPPVTGG